MASKSSPVSQLSSGGISPPAKGKLAALVGVLAAALLYQQIPAEESGRTVRVAVSDNGAATINHVAGPQYLRAYLDVAGIATACDGITRGVRLGKHYSEAECTALLERELLVHAKGAMACSPGLQAAGRDYQRAAAVSLAYNIGISGWCGSTARKRLDAGNVTGSCLAFASWNKARVHGALRPVQGLTRRRSREIEICLTGVTAGRTAANLPARIRAVK